MRRADHIVLIAVEIFVAGKMGQAKAFDSFKSLAIKAGGLPAMFDPVGKIAQLNVENRGLNVIEQGGAAMVMEFAGLPVFAVKSHESCKAGDFRIVGGYSAAIPQAA